MASLCSQSDTKTKHNLLETLNLAAELVQVALQPKSPKISLPTCCKEQAVNCSVLNNVHTANFDNIIDTKELYIMLLKGTCDAQE